MAVSLPTIAAGDDYEVDVTLTKDGATYDLTGATVTGTIEDGGGVPRIVAAPVTLVSPASGIVQLSLTDGQTAVLLTYTDPLRARQHTADFKIVEAGGNVAHSDVFIVPVRKAVTA